MSQPTAMVSGRQVVLVLLEPPWRGLELGRRRDVAGRVVETAAYAVETLRTESSTSNYGRAVLARWRRTGRVPPAA